MKNILIIQGHPVKDAFSQLVADNYIEGVKNSGGECKLIALKDLKFDLNFSEGYRGNQELEDDLVEAQKWISWADHIVFIYPNWWGTYPALVKGFIDRVFLPGFAFKYRQGSLLWDKLLKGKSARLIVSMDTPKWYYYLIYKAPGHYSMKRGILGFCGIKPVRITSLGPMKKSTENQRNNWLMKIKKLGKKMI